MQVGSAGQHVAEEFLQRVDRLRVVGPQLVKEFQPAGRFGCGGLVLERHRDPVEEQWRQFQQFPGADVE